MNKGVTSRGSIIGSRGVRGGGSVLSSSTCGTLLMLSIHQNTVLYISPYKLKERSIFSAAGAEKDGELYGITVLHH